MIRGFKSAAKLRLAAGTLRELENVIERLALNALDTDVVSAADVSLDLEVNGFTQSNEIAKSCSPKDYGA